MDRFHEARITNASPVSVAAKRMENGCRADGAEGMEAGGHGSSEVVEAVSIPVLVLGWRR